MKLTHFLIVVLVCLIKLGHVKGYETSLKNPDEKKLSDFVIDFLKPHQDTIRRWFWEISGVTYNSPYGNTERQSRADYIDCPLCTQALPVVRDILDAGIESEVIISILDIACQVLDLAPKKEICRPTIESYATSVLYIIKNKPDMPDGDFCGIINPGCNEISEKLTTWKVNVNHEKPPPKTKPEIPANIPLTRIVHFTDVHLDLDYDEGEQANCGLPICCRSEFTVTPPTNERNKAGKWGHFSCALPEQSLIAMYNHSNSEFENAEFVFLTGDYIHSGIWLYGVEENRRHLSRVSTLLKETFPKTTEIYPLVGNHEPDVVNMYPSESAWGDFPLEWMYDAVAEPFKDSLPPLQYNLFRKYGYYAVTSKKDRKLRLIVLNTNLCYINNFWLPYDAIDTYGQLQWFVNELNLAERLGQKVFVLGHIHPGSGSCWPVWSNQFQRIIDRYEHLIRGQFYGHSHEMDYKLTFEAETARPISVSYVGGSAVTDGMNPGYNVYFADGERGTESTWEIVNHQSFVLNLTSSNANPDNEDPEFALILDASKDFGLKSLVPEEIYGLVNRMVCDDELFYKYQMVSTKGADSPRFRPCLNNTQCKADNLGSLFVSNSADRSHSDKLKEHILSVDCNEVIDNGVGGIVGGGTTLIVTLLCGFLFMFEQRI